ncbi:hypothetical protein [Granulicella sp. dw_53]|uniref:hypothetical protein n=1 Tax=Granulicella sp. dw_53 TaxID=2719792 RepID=UPI001BD43125|nr:hypothetical protein [Granulicella sp. dw_53]
MTRLTLLSAATALMIAASALAPAPAQAAPVSAAVESSRAAAKLQYAGALTFSPDGVLFVGDNISGAVFAYPMSEGAAPTTASALDIEVSMTGSPRCSRRPSPASTSTVWRSIPPATTSICRFRSALEAQPW